MKRATIVLGLLIVAYGAGYFVVRSAYQEIWDVDGFAYVMFPADGLLYTVFRPASYLDGMLTGMRFHIGPHQ